MRSQVSELRLHDPETSRLRIRCEPPARKVEPYFAVYAVVFCREEPDEPFDSECLAKFPGGTNLEHALDCAENLSRIGKFKPETVLVVNDHNGRECGRFPVLGVVPEPEKKRAGWFWRMLGWRK